MKKLDYSEFKNAIRQFDIKAFISCSSFEARCFVIPNLLNDCHDCQYVYFYNNNEDEIIRKNAAYLCTFKDNSINLELNSEEPITNYTVIDNYLAELTIKYKTPDILIDITTFTHETLLILLKALEINKIALGKIHFAYVGASNYSYNSDSDEEKWLSKGIKIIRTVLGYPGLTDPTKKNHLMILFGFESERTKRIIEEYEFDFISLGFGDINDSIQSNHYKINCERHKSLLTEFPNAKEFKFSLIDAVKTKNDILRYLESENLLELNTVIAPLNTKISTLGAGLAALENENIQLAYAKPNLYNTEAYSIPNEFIYLDTISL